MHAELIHQIIMGFLIFIMAIILMTNSKMMTPRAAGQQESRFTIRNDRFYLDDKPFQIISGAIHYFRIHPELWKDRLIRCKALGLNAVEIYVPWNYHEERPGEYRWSGEADIERFIDIAQELDLMVLVRAGPYICAEWEFGGFPAWLSSPAVAGGGKMRLRSSDPVYLAHVERWWRALFSRLRKYLVTSGGPVLMVQIENEYGYCGSDKVYLRHLAKYAKALLGDNVILYTTDPAAVTSAGSLPGDEVLTTVDFGPGWFYPEQYYAAQRSMNAAGRSPPVDSEFYTGWLTHWGEAMANTSADALAADTDTLLRWENNSGNLNFYMVHGGTNFGFWAGANVDYDGTYMPTITSYDYHAPISEAGDYCQPGIGGGCKFHAVRAAIAGYIGTDPPSIPDRPAIKAYGSIEMVPVGPLVHDDSDGNLVKPLLSDVPLPMEDYGQKWGIIVYRTRVSLDQMFGLGGSDDGYLDVGLPVHDYATVLLNGTAVGTLERSGSSGLKINRSRVASMTTEQGEQGAIVMDIVVQGMGRQNFGCDAFAYGAWDRKGLQDQKVLLNGQELRGWEVFNFDFEDLSKVPNVAVIGDNALTDKGDLGDEMVVAPTFYRGTLRIEGSNSELVVDAGGSQHLACTYLDMSDWGKGIAWVNSFNLGWYWPSKGPQMTLYVPGPVLKEGDNEIIFLELGKKKKTKQLQSTTKTAVFTDQPNFYGPQGRQLAKPRLNRVHSQDHGIVAYE